MDDLKDIRDDQIRIIGEDRVEKRSHRKLLITILSIVGIGLIVGIILFISHQKEVNNQELKRPEPSLFEPESVQTQKNEAKDIKRIGQQPDSTVSSYTEIKDTTINDIPMAIFIPYNAEMTLQIGRLNKKDKSIIYAAQAADVRADNGEIVGAFVIKGEAKSNGLSKKGYCASIDGEVTIGVAENSPLFEKATEKKGYFFRQYPLVSNGRVVENKLRGKSIRRAICDRHGEIFMVETGTKESFHDFSQALVDLGVDQAVYLVGSNAYGWAVDKDGTKHEFGDENIYSDRRQMPKNTSYIVWKKK